ncbi:MAG: hypothetical protein NXI12_04150 [Alphaproteobacteria bacterium]|nr:hypothetical protein [Alphaproteobacteria bacterium]
MRLVLTALDGDRLGVNLTRVDRIHQPRRGTRSFQITGTLSPTYASRAQASASRESRPGAARSAVEPGRPAPPDVSPLSAQPASSGLAARMRNIDDIGLVAVMAPDGVIQNAAAAEWTAAGGPGYGQADLAPYLDDGVNAVFFLLHNKIFNFGVGRWAYDFELSDAAGQVLWRGADTAPQRFLGIRFWKAFLVEVRNGRIVSIRAANAQESAEFQPLIDQMHALMSEEFRVEESAGNLAAALLIAGIMSDTGAGSAMNDDDFLMERQEMMHHFQCPGAPGC